MVEAALDVPLRSYTSLNKRFTKLHVQREGRTAALGNNKSLLIYHFQHDEDADDQEKRHDVYRHKDETKRLFAMRFNPHYSRRMHLASAKGQLVYVWDLESKAVSPTSPRGVTTLRQPTSSNVMDLCWHRFNENLLAAGDFLWDTREQNPVKEWKVPGGDSRGSTSQVSFNRTNPYLLATAKLNQVYIWDSRKGHKPIDTIPVSLPTDPVTSLDWSSKSEYDLLTSGGENFSLWRVDSAKAKEVVPRGSMPSKRKGASVLVKKRTWNQPVKKVLFAPFGQAAITLSGGFFEDKQEIQTIKMWSIPSSDLQLVATFRAGTYPLVGVSWRSTGDGYQVASLDDADHLRLHDVEKLDFSRPAVELPAGDASGMRDYGSMAGSESLETAVAPQPPVLREEILPVVWRLSEPRRPSKSASETTLDTTVRELVQAERIAIRGGFGPVTNVTLCAAQKSLTFVMTATPPSAQSAQLHESRLVYPQPSVADATHTPRPSGAQSAVSRLRITTGVQPGQSSKDGRIVVQLTAEGRPAHSTQIDPATALDENPLNEAAVKRMQDDVEDILRQPLKPGKSRVEACLKQLRRQLDERVRDAASQAAGGLPGETLPSQQLELERLPDVKRLTSPCRNLLRRILTQQYLVDLAEGSVLPGGLSDDDGIPCPRRFGATFAANGSLVVFSSSMEVVRAGHARAEGGDEQMCTHPRTYGQFKECLKAGQLDDNGDEELEGGIDQPHPPDSRGRFRSAWGESEPDESSENQDDGMYHLDRTSTEEAFVEDDGEALEANVIADNTWLPISHPDHSLGAGLGQLSEDEGDVQDADNTTAEADIEGQLPWTPKYNTTLLVDCSGLTPGSPVFAAFYDLGPMRRAPAHDEDESANDPTLGRERDTRQDTNNQLFGLLDLDRKAYSLAGSDTSASSGGRSRRNSLVQGVGASSGMPPALSVSQRGFSAALDNAARGSSSIRKLSIDGRQVIPPVITRMWESSPDFQVLLGKSGGSGRSMIGGSPLLVGSPGRSELARGIKISSPRFQTQTSELEDVAEFPVDSSSVSVTPPRSTGGVGADSATLPSAHSHIRTRQRLGKRRQYQQFPKSPGSSGGPSPPLDTPRLRLGALAPASPTDISTSPPLSDPGTDLGQIYVSAGQANATVSRSSSFSTGSGGAFGDLTVDRALAVHVGLSGRGHHTSIDRPTAVDAAGAGLCPGANLGGSPKFKTAVEDGSAEDPAPTVGQLSRHNTRVAAARNCGELASVWAMLSEASGRGAPGRRDNSGLGKLRDARQLPPWSAVSTRSTLRILAHHETCADPQTLASIAAVVGSGSLDGGCAAGLSKGGRLTFYDRYLDCYAERCCQWGAEAERAETLGHHNGAHGPRTVQALRIQSLHETPKAGGGRDEVVCVMCDNIVRGKLVLCRSCGHGGHPGHLARWFSSESECRQESCVCLCRKTSWRKSADV